MWISLTVLHRGRVWRKYEEVPMVKVNNWDTDDVEEIVTHGGGGGGGRSSNCLIWALKARTTLL